MKLALQMYSVRDGITNAQELFTALEKVKALGYDGVEFAGYFGADPKELAGKLAQLGLTVVGSHEGIDAMEKDMDGLLDYAVALGNSTISMAYSLANSPAEVERTLRVLTMAKEKAGSRGVRILYHNHDHEFRMVGDVRPMDEIVKVTDLEVDCYWVFFAGEKPGDYLRSKNGHVGLVHLKDGGKDKPSPCAIGEGDVDIADIVSAAAETGHQWLVVENDDPVPNGLADVERSVNWLRAQNLL